MITDHCLNGRYFVRKGDNGSELWAITAMDETNGNTRVIVDGILMEETFRSLENAENFLKARRFKERT